MRRPRPLQRLRDAFQSRLGRGCTVIARAPGRVNLIGEHTDYNEGFVLPMAIQPGLWVAAAGREDGLLRAISLNLRSEQTWPIDDWQPQGMPGWTSYVAGVAKLLRQRGVQLRGCDLLIDSELTVGGGLSSSAALEIATGLALTALAGVSLDPVELADLCRRAEHEFAGVHCGIMDQYACLLARAGHALLLDCRSRRWQHIPLKLKQHAILIVDTGVRHELATSEYAMRQEQCRRAVEHFQRTDPSVQALRDLDLHTVLAQAPEMDPVIAARARHVVSENQRTQAAAQALCQGDLAELGRLMNDSHDSLRDDYEVSCPQLDRLVEILRAVPGVRGARMTGGGFGGCVVAVAERASLGPAQAAIRRQYRPPESHEATVTVTEAGPGATIESP